MLYEGRIFSSKQYDEKYFKAANTDKHELVFFETKLAPRSLSLAEGAKAVCVFVNDKVQAETLKGLKELEDQYVSLRSGVATTWISPQKRNLE